MSVRGITRRFRRLPPAPGQVAHALLARPPRERAEARPVRLACIRRAASVDPEPGSNSPPRSPKGLSAACVRHNHIRTSPAGPARSVFDALLNSPATLAGYHRFALGLGKAAPRTTSGLRVAEARVSLSTCSPGQTESNPLSERRTTNARWLAAPCSERPDNYFPKSSGGYPFSRAQVV